MRKEFVTKVNNIDLFKKKVLIYGSKFKRFAFLDSNNFNQNNSEHTYYEYDYLAGIGSIKEIISNDPAGFILAAKNTSGFKPFTESALDFVRQGITSLDEVIRITGSGV